MNASDDDSRNKSCSDALHQSGDDTEEETNNHDVKDANLDHKNGKRNSSESEKDAVKKEKYEKRGC